MKPGTYLPWDATCHNISYSSCAAARLHISASAGAEASVTHVKASAQAGQRSDAAHCGRPCHGAPCKRSQHSHALTHTPHQQRHSLCSPDICQCWLSSSGYLVQQMQRSALVTPHRSRLLGEPHLGNAYCSNRRTRALSVQMSDISIKVPRLVASTQHTPHWLLCWKPLQVCSRL